jgi:hypothetical protein
MYIIIIGLKMLYSSNRRTIAKIKGRVTKGINVKTLTAVLMNFTVLDTERKENKCIIESETIDLFFFKDKFNLQ